MATVYEIIQGINQAAANAYDGSQHEELAADGLSPKGRPLKRKWRLYF